MWCAVAATVHFSAAVVFFQSVTLSFSRRAVASSTLASNSLANASPLAPMVSSVIRFPLASFRCPFVSRDHPVVFGSRGRLAPGIEAVGVTSVAGFRWTRRSQRAHRLRRSPHVCSPTSYATAAPIDKSHALRTLRERLVPSGLDLRGRQILEVRCERPVVAEGVGHDAVAVATEHVRRGHDDHGAGVRGALDRGVAIFDIVVDCDRSALKASGEDALPLRNSGKSSTRNTKLPPMRIAACMIRRPSGAGTR